MAMATSTKSPSPNFLYQVLTLPTKSPSPNFLYQVLTLPTKNTKLFLPLFTIITLFNFISILYYFFFMEPLSADIALKDQALVNTDPTSPEFSVLNAVIQEESNELFVELKIYAVISIFVYFIFKIIIFFAIAATYTGELLTLGELLVKAKRNMKGPIITHFYGSFLCFLCSLPLGLLTLFLLFSKKLGSYTFIMFSILALVLFLLDLLLLFIMVPLSMVVSVVETGCYGPRAFKRAAKLAKEKKMKGFLIFLVSALLFIALYTIYKMSLKYSSSSTASVFVLWFFYNFFTDLMAMYISVSFVIYYFECKKSQGEGEEEEEEQLKSGGFVYKRVPTKAIHVDEELP